MRWLVEPLKAGFLLLNIEKNAIDIKSRNLRKQRYASVIAN
jgi:hypothetical protein